MSARSTDEALKAALDPLFPGAAWPDRYPGEALIYVTWNHWTVPEVYANGLPAAARHPTQVHLFLPFGVDPEAYLLQVPLALHGEGFTWPGVTNASDAEGQHWVFECEYVNGGAVYGQL